MVTANEAGHPWPRVTVDDDGIRPAGRPDECFYCSQTVGDEHARDCVIVTRPIVMDICVDLPERTLRGTWALDVPHSWDEEMIRFRYGESTWCADNLLYESDHIRWVDIEQNDAWSLLEKEREECLCVYWVAPLAIASG